MLIALNHENKLIRAHKNLNRKHLYYCPSCKKPVHLKVGVVMCTHFAHFKNEACDVFSEGETEEHLQGKLQLCNWIHKASTESKESLNIQMEAYLSKLKQRPDLLVTKNGVAYAIEFQCSPITVEKVLERTKGYLNVGYEVIWILGNQFKFQKQLTVFQKACLYFEQKDITRKLKLYHYDVTKKQLIMRSDFRLEQNKNMKCKTQIITLGSKIKIEDAETKQTKRILSKQEVINRQDKLMKELRYPTEKSKKFFQLLYQRQENIVSIPYELYFTVPSEWLIQSYELEWKYQFILWLETLPKYRIITRNYLLRWLKEQEINYYTIPRLSDDQKLAPFYEYIDFLVQKEILRNVSADQWTVKQSFTRYKNLEEKYNSFN